MGVYLVRRIEDHGVLGIFWGDRYDVWSCVDEVGDPAIFEYAALKPGAIYAEDCSNEPQWPQDTISEDEDEDEDAGGGRFAAYTSSESLSEAIHNQKRLRWHKFMSAVDFYTWLIEQQDMRQAARGEP